MTGALRYEPSLDGLRAIAVLLVIVHHTHVAPWNGGTLGVDVFFVLSGYLITRILRAEQADTGRVSLRRFYGRRALRLWPALLAMLLVVVLLEYADVLRPNPGGRGPAVAAGIAGLYLSNVVEVVRPALIDPFGHTWSLAVEEQFYLAWPFALLLLRRVRRPLVWVLAGAALSVLLLAIGNTVVYHPVPTYVLPVTHAVGLLLGATLAMTDRWTSLPWRRLAGPSALALLALVALLPDRNGALRAFGIVAASVSTVPVLAYLLQEPRSLAARLLGSAAPRTIGRWSYALYLWHYPLIVGLRHAHPTSARTASVVGAALAFPAAAASFYFVERPFQRWKARLRPAVEAAVPDAV